MPLRNSFRSRAAALTALVILAAACSGESSSAPTDSAAPETPAPTTTVTVPETDESTTTSTTEPTTTTTTPPLVYPLTGLPAPDPLAMLRPVVVAKVGNYDSHPPAGLNKADIVYEEIINDNIPRFAAAFQSQGPGEAVGPIRSGRRQDVDLLGSLGQPILAWSGGNRTVTAEIDNSDLIDLSPNYCAGACFRVGFDKAPYNLFFDIDGAWAVGATKGPGIPQQQFQYRGADDALQGGPSAGVYVTMDSYDVEWTWNPATGLYERRQNGHVARTIDGDQITTNNLVILSMTYRPGISGSPDAQSVGSGETWVFTGGNLVHGTWTRSERLQPFTLTADDGAEILLTPGRTFIELPRAAYGTVAPK